MALKNLIDWVEPTTQDTSLKTETVQLTKKAQGSNVNHFSANSNQNYQKIPSTECSGGCDGGCGGCI